MTPSLCSTLCNRADRCIERWSLNNVRWIDDHVGTAKLAFCESPSGPAVLKVSLEANMIADEHAALKQFGPEVCPAVYAFSEEDSALLLEAVGDGTTLAPRYPNPEAEIDVFLTFYDRIKSGGGTVAGSPNLAEFAEIFDRLLSRPQPAEARRILEIARAHKSILLDTDNPRLLHGDMHHFNILNDGKGGWRLVDPHGVVGSPLYELGAFLRNPWPHCYTEPGVRARLQERVSVLADRMHEPSELIALFGFYGAAFSLAWDLEEQTVFEGMIKMSNELADLAKLR